MEVKSTDQPFRRNVNDNLVYTAPLAALTSSGELLVPVWLVIMGVNAEQWKKRALVAA